MINIRYLYIHRRKLHDSAKMLNFFWYCRYRWRII